jgi:hypothetical protein
VRLVPIKPGHTLVSLLGHSKPLFLYCTYCNYRIIIDSSKATAAKKLQQQSYSSKEATAAKKLQQQRSYRSKAKAAKLK